MYLLVFEFTYINAAGGTLFIEAFKEISKIIHNNFIADGQREDISIVFFTDGCDNNDRGRQQEIQKVCPPVHAAH